MAINYAYNYAEIDPDTNMCIGVYSVTYISNDPNWVQIPTDSDEYFFKYYNREDGKWYNDAEFQDEAIELN